MRTERVQHTEHMESKLMEMGGVIRIHNGRDLVSQLFQNSKHPLKSTQEKLGVTHREQ